MFYVCGGRDFYPRKCVNILSVMCRGLAGFPLSLPLSFSLASVCCLAFVADIVVAEKGDPQLQTNQTSRQRQRWMEMKTVVYTGETCL